MVLPVPHTPEEVPVVPPNIDSPPKPPVEEPPSKDPDEDKPVEEPERSPPEVPPHDEPQPDPVDDPTPNEPPLDDPGRTPPVKEPPRDFGVADGIRTHNNWNPNAFSCQPRSRLSSLPSSRCRRRAARSHPPASRTDRAPRPRASGSTSRLRPGRRGRCGSGAGCPRPRDAWRACGSRRARTGCRPG